MNKTELEKTFDSFSDYNVLIIGDVMVDAYVWGKVDRISPEAPVPIVSCVNRESRLGGAANVALNIKSMGANPILCSVIGNDEKGEEFLNLLTDIQDEQSGIVVSKHRRTTVKTRFISDNQHIIRVDEEDTHELADEIEVEFIHHIKNLLDKHEIHAVIFEDYDKGVITKKLIDEITKFANDKNIPILVDPKKRHYSDYKNVSLFKPNFKEFVEGSNLNLEKGNIEGLFTEAKKFQNKMNINKLLITLSELGVFISNEDTFEHIPAVVREIADVSGAGDTVISVATLCLAAGLNAKEIAAISNLAGGIVCEIPVVVPIEKEQLLKESIKLFAKV
ncbi:bifunctional heptose 7-phosphate kinase/heptose 1-phosphate adenyltransferase [Marinifilum sp. D737]|uniref:bifunctional heptose 7-phosphate kinase/heptose 1-phosphate adenyltransferase n=1 Tax=Marinifilum sp. D737 TaxID=2969628 RepID=UPI00227481FB|nr:bifunctional ADP-heptose synthase [Marinifilum sp. D737]MCY1632838.1 bifunctional ADP-heptose synthase [Marinifilum sp. D737]